MTRWSFKKFVFFFKHFLLIDLCLAAPGSSLLSMSFLSSCGKQKLLSFMGCRLLVVVASTVTEHRVRVPAAAVLWAGHLGSQLWRTWLLCSMWNLHEWGIKQCKYPLHWSPNLLFSDIKAVWKLPLSYLEYCWLYLIRVLKVHSKVLMFYLKKSTQDEGSGCEKCQHKQWKCNIKVYKWGKRRT